MLKLDAVNICIRALGDPAVSALDTNGTSDEGEAETIIDRQNAIIQRGGWAPNIRLDMTLDLPNRSITCSGGAGEFEYGELVTQAVSGATGTFYYEEDSRVYVKDVSGTFNGASALAGGTSGATRAVTTSTAAITTAKHALPESVFLSAKRGSIQAPFSVVGGFAFDHYSQSSDYTGPLTINAIILLDFEDLPGWLAEYVAWEAAQEFQIAKKRGVTDDRYIERSLGKARARARCEDQDIRRHGLIPALESTRHKPFGPMP